MTPQEIAQKAGIHIDENISDDSFILDVINQFQEDIAELLPTLDSQSITVTADTWTDLPVNLINIVTVELNGKEYYYGGYLIRDTQPRKIRFSESGTFTLFYHRTPNIITSDTQELDLHPYLHSLGVLFMQSKALSKGDEEQENSQALSLMNEYREKRDNRITKIKNPSGRNKRVRDVYADA